MAQPAVTDRELRLAELVHHRAHDAGTGEDDFRAFRLQADDAPARIGVLRAVQLDLPVDLGAVEHGALHDLGVVARQAVADRGEVGHRPAHRRERIGQRTAFEARQVRGDRRQRLAQCLVRHLAVEPVAFGVAHRADIDAEALVDDGAMAEGELRATAAGVEDHQRALIQPEPSAGGDEGQPGLLVARDDLDRHTALRAHGGYNLGPVGGHAQAGRADGGDRAHAVSPGLVGHVGNSRHGTVARAVEDRAAGAQALAEARDLRAVDERAPSAARSRFGDDELDRVGAGVDHRVALTCAVDQRRQPAGVAGIDPIAQAEAAHRGDHRRCILGLHRQRARGPAGGLHLGQLGSATANDVAHAPLVHRHGAHRSARGGEAGHEAVLRERVGHRVGQWQPQRLQHLRHLGRRQREAALHHRRPLLEPVGIDLAQHLDVHQRIAHLDVRARPG